MTKECERLIHSCSRFARRRRGKKILVVNRSYDTLVAQAMGSVFVVREEWMRASGEGRWAKEDGFEIFCDSTIYDMLCSESENASGKGWVTTMSRSLLSGGGGAFRNARLFEGQVGKGRARRMLRGVGVVVLDVIGIGVAEELSSDEDEEEMDVSNCKKSKSEEEEEEEEEFEDECGFKLRGVGVGVGVAAAAAAAASLAHGQIENLVELRGGTVINEGGWEDRHSRRVILVDDSICPKLIGVCVNKAKERGIIRRGDMWVGREEEEGKGKEEVNEEKEKFGLGSANRICVVRWSWLLDSISAHVAVAPLEKYAMGWIMICDEHN